MIVRRTFFAAVAGLLLSFSLDLSSATAGEQDPKAFVTNLANTAMETMTVKDMSDQERAAKFRALFTSEVDLHEIAKFVLGRHWRPPTTPEQQQEFLKVFEDTVVLTWAPRFKDYGGDLRHTVVAVTQDGDRGITVDSKVDRERQTPIALQWRLKRHDGGLRVVDLVVEGSSMAITYRSEYAAVIQANGGKVEGLLSAMRAKLTELQTGNAVTKAN
ncbi:MAG: ABC transporter substrate-binding protein [Magnetospirillum sp.]|nr:MAG: ABC transporter substrate-binding protein [Magnetospirillum sp.]